MIDHIKFKIHSKEYFTYEYKEIGVQGVGNAQIPIINMDKFIDHSQDTELHIECCKGLALTNNYKMGMTYGAIPPEERQRFSNNDCWSELLRHIDENDPYGLHREAIREIEDTLPPEDQQYAVYKYTYFAMGAPIPWYFALYIKKGDFFKKTNDTYSSWTDEARLFPKLVKYLDSLPFKSIGRVLFFTTYPNAGVMIHRDSIMVSHKDHNINLFFSGGSRPSFVWDEITKQKTYLDQNARSYFFNNRDYHGVDPEPVFRYTLRVDGTFTDEMCEKLGLEDGYTWRSEYSSR